MFSFPRQPRPCDQLATSARHRYPTGRIGYILRDQHVSVPDMARNSLKHRTSPGCRRRILPCAGPDQEGACLLLLERPDLGSHLLRLHQSSSGGLRDGGLRRQARLQRHHRPPSGHPCRVLPRARSNEVELL